MSLLRAIYLFLLVVVVWTGSYLYQKNSEQLLQVPPNIELPTFSGKTLTNLRYSETGLRNYKIASDHLDHYAKSGNTVFTMPILTVYSNNGKIAEWRATAKHAVLDKSNILTLYDDVMIKSLLDDANFDAMTTIKLSIQLTKRDFWADHQVLLVGPQFEIKGAAMKGNFGDNTAVLYNQVQGIYERLTP